MTPEWPTFDDLEEYEQDDSLMPWDRGGYASLSRVGYDRARHAINALPGLVEALKIAQDSTDKWMRSEHGADFFEVGRVLRAALRLAESKP